jgi:hypothetical protein
MLYCAGENHTLQADERRFAANEGKCEKEHAFEDVGK